MTPERVGLFGADPVVNLLLACAIGLVVGLYPGLEGARRVERATIPPLLDELAAAVERPLAADAGEIRTAAAVSADIELAQGRVRGRYFTLWLGVALPIALGLSLVRRRA
jgi:hypothetical protein